MKIKHIFGFIIATVFFGIAAAALAFFVASHDLPQIMTLADYKPLVVTQVYARDGETKIAEFFREKRVVVPYTEIPQQLVHAFISAEDNQFFEHGGINFVAIMRAMIANIKAGHAVQGGSTITQQVTKSLLLTPEKTLTRKLKEAILAFRIEKNLKKEDILFLYLNQIYLGHGAYGVEAAAQNYFRKHVKDMTLAECAMLAGLPQAPSKYSPVLNPTRAKERQIYVLGRMLEDKQIDKDTMLKAAAEPVKVFYREDFTDLAPHFSEIVRQMLVEKLGERTVLDEGIRVYTTLDPKKQKAAQESVEKNLRELSRRQGFRGPKKNLKTAEEVAQFLTKTRDEYFRDSLPYLIVAPTEKDQHRLAPLDLVKKAGAPNLPIYLKVGQIVDGVVTKVDSKYGLVTVRVAEAVGLIDIDEMSWARKPNPEKVALEEQIKDPAKALAIGDVIQVKIKSEKFSSPRLDKQFATIGKKKKTLPAELPIFIENLGLTLEQEPVSEASLLSFDLANDDVLAMIGGRNYEKSEYNRALQSARQTGSAFKAFVYAAALEKGYNPASVIFDAPVVFEEGEGQELKRWKPGNFSEKFSGEVLFRNALIKSLNVPTVKIIEKIGVDWVIQYSRHLGIYHPLNKDFTMALGSSGLSLYEMTKAFSVFAKSGRAIKPMIIRKVTDSKGTVLVENIGLDEKVLKETSGGAEASPSPNEAATTSAAQKAADKNADAAAATANVDAANPPAFNADAVFNSGDKNQVIPKTSAYIVTHLLKGVINEGTGARAKALGKPAAGKTGTTNGYYDALFVGYTPGIATGVWVGNDNESSLGRLETGASSALPIWLDYMMVATEDQPGNDFEVPPGIVFANIDATTGKLASSRSQKVVKEAFKEGNEPTSTQGESTPGESKDFYKDELSE